MVNSSPSSHTKAGVWDQQWPPHGRVQTSSSLGIIASTWSWGVPVTQDQRYTLGPVADRSLKNKPLFWDLLEGFLSDLCTISRNCLHQHDHFVALLLPLPQTAAVSAEQQKPLPYFYTPACDFTLDHRALHLVWSCTSDVSTCVSFHVGRVSVGVIQPAGFRFSWIASLFFLKCVPYNSRHHNNLLN